MTYVLYRVHSFACDHPGCTKEEEHAEPDKRAANRQARKAGWFISPRGDFCPAHWSDGDKP